MQKTHWLEFFDGERRHRTILTASHYSIGRDATCDICLPRRWVSRHHATLIQQSQDGMFCYQIIDGTPAEKPSANGIYVNGHQVKSHILQHWDEIVIGQDTLTYYLGFPGDDDPEDDLPEPIAIR